MWLLDILPGLSLPTLILAGAANLIYTALTLWREGIALSTLCMGLMGLGELTATLCLWLFRRGKGTEKTRRILKQTAKLGGVILGAGFVLTLVCTGLGPRDHPVVCRTLLGLTLAGCAGAGWGLLRPKRPPREKPELTAKQREGLERLDRMKVAGLLEKEEYEARRQEVLKPR